ncbi:cytochrome c biogenesis CcdA family protein [Enteractinococcus helveticum]|uniref:Cytochrome C biogenesis protein n=1 Tax=Enteractinococcus helveticum TaxID=1837282 RepID=A0A1B7M1I3_9MICC|nr:cytochrome c biogenesis CcdA family protein [Enteractinococcus helveticum]OAV62415.1 cytochrome C biogenesis protein [Enteractinococcus helveticum]
MEISLVTAFLGGVLALLSPCGALLLPAFFASVIGQRMRLLLHGGVFYLGLVVTLVPLGLGLGAVGSLLTEYRGALIVTTSVILILLGLVQAAGFGFDLSKALPGAGSLQQRAHSRGGFVRTVLLGAASGVAGFCSGPILGAILTLAVAQGNTWNAGVMLAVYGLGMVVPLTILAAVWHKLSPRALSVLRGRGFRFLGRDLHTTSVVTGLLIVALGVVFWTTNGLVSAPSLLPTGIQRGLQSYSGVLANPLVDAILLAAVVVVVITIWAVRRSRNQVKVQQPSEEEVL